MDLSNLANLDFLYPVTSQIFGSISTEDLTKYLTWATSAAGVSALMTIPAVKKIVPGASRMRKTLETVQDYGSLAALAISIELRRRSVANG